MSITYYMHDKRELPLTGVQPDELIIYTGTVRGEFCDDPCADNHESSSTAYAFCWQDGEAQDLDACFQTDAVGGWMDVTAAGQRYVFACSRDKDFLRQISGPARPIVVGNIGADAVRVDTLLGKYMIPAGTVLRLDRNTPQREKKKVLLTFADRGAGQSCLESALMLDGQRWRPLNICADDKLIRIKDGTFTVQSLKKRGYCGGLELKAPPCEPDYEIYLRDRSHWPILYFDGIGMEDEGLAPVERSFSPEKDVIYDFQRLRQAPATKLMAQCTAGLPGLDGLNGTPGENIPWPEAVQAERDRVPEVFPALRSFLDP